MKKRVLRALLCIVLCIGLLPVSALAAAGEFGVQLSGYARNLYDAMNDSPAILQTFRTGESFDLTFDGPFDNPNAMANELASALLPAFAALQMDHPELFWLTGTGANISGNSQKLVMKVTPTFAVNWASGARSVSTDASTLESAVRRLAAEAAAQGDAYAQLLYVHDWLTTHNEYNTGALARGAEQDYLPWTPLSALTDISQPVCEGYAEAFQLVCIELGIPCLTVVGTADIGSRRESHAWNQVLLDGCWYAVDATFDDGILDGVHGNISGYETQDYFLVGANTDSGDGKPFSKTHFPTGEKVKGAVFTYPALSAEAYDPTGRPQGGQPETPSSVPAPNVVLSAQRLTVDGKAVECEKYNIGGSNYFKLRDLAYLLNGTGSQFSVVWDESSGTIAIVTGGSYVPNGTELDLSGGDKSATAQVSAQRIVVDLEEIDGLSVYNIGGSNFFKLRELGDLLGFQVGYDAASNTATVTSIGAARPAVDEYSSTLADGKYTVHFDGATADAPGGVMVGISAARPEGGEFADADGWLYFPDNVSIVSYLHGTQQAFRSMEAFLEAEDIHALGEVPVEVTVTGGRVAACIIRSKP